MTALLWTLGACLLTVAAVLPYLAGLRRARESAARGQDRAQAAISRLEHELDHAAVSPEKRREAERCLLLAGAALAGPTGTADADRAQRWAEAGLRALDS